jgi:hypothetical protein
MYILTSVFIIQINIHIHMKVKLHRVYKTKPWRMENHQSLNIIQQIIFPYLTTQPRHEAQLFDCIDVIIGSQHWYERLH